MEHPSAMVTGFRQTRPGSFPWADARGVPPCLNQLEADRQTQTARARGQIARSGAGQSHRPPEVSALARSERSAVDPAVDPAAWMDSRVQCCSGGPTLQTRDDPRRNLSSRRAAQESATRRGWASPAGVPEIQTPPRARTEAAACRLCWEDSRVVTPDRDWPLQA